MIFVRIKILKLKSFYEIKMSVISFPLVELATNALRTSSITPKDTASGKRMPTKQCL